ncbi:MAG: hypothetical protein KAS65_10790 [Candidatus Aminicenantes bacterium]|nr:hypothetical protein [Candidatus Aminicenantes bacterium]
MKKYSLLIVFIIGVSFFISAQEPVLNLGKIYFPNSFVHAQKDYQKGTYRVFLATTGEVPYFKVFNRKNEFLFEEMAIVKPYTGKYKKFKYRLKKGVLRGYEYFRIRVTRPDNIYLAFFFLKKRAVKEEKPRKPPEDKSTTD